MDFAWACYQAHGSESVRVRICGIRHSGTDPAPGLTCHPRNAMFHAFLILQLDMGDVPFFVDFGDVGVGHLYLDPAADKAYFTWTSG